MPSIQSKLFYSILRTVNAKKIIDKTVERVKRRNKPFFSGAERQKYQIFSTSIDNKEVSIMGKNRQGLGHVIFFHGGMYVVEANTAHKRWLVNLYENLGGKITFVDYPLAPEHSYRETMVMVVNTYQYLTRKYPQDVFTLMGDSAGGGLALALAHYLRDHDFDHRPERCILYSPWVRLDMHNPKIQEVAHKEVLLDLGLLNKSAKCYAGESDLTHPYLSPYYGSCAGLGTLHVFYGSDEILAPDISLLERKCKAEKAGGNFYCYEGMGHDFQLFTFLPESQNVLSKTIQIINTSVAA